MKKDEKKKFDSMKKILRKSSYALFLTVFLAAIHSCTTIEDQSYPVVNDIVTKTWEEADRLFRGDLRWLGADDAYSIDLKDGRVLWLFGDTFIATTDKRLRSESAFVRNSIGIQTGYDPSRATIEFYWRGPQCRPESFFPEKNGDLALARTRHPPDSKLLVFLMVIRSADNELGFDTVGWRGVMISNIDSRPSDWQLTWLEEPSQNFGVLVGSGSVLRRDNFLYAFGYQPATRDIHAVRWHVSDVLAAKIDQPQWWTGPDSGWKAASHIDGHPVPLIAEGQSEFTIHYEPQVGQFLEIQTVGFGPAWIAMRSSETLTGPWSTTNRFYRPDEHRIPDIMIYAAKAHPHLIGDGLVLTYVTNSFNFDQAVRNDQIYYPRFLRIHFNSN